MVMTSLCSDLHDGDGMEHVLPVLDSHFVRHLQLGCWQSPKGHVPIIRATQAPHLLQVIAKVLLAVHWHCPHLHLLTQVGILWDRIQSDDTSLAYLGTEFNHVSMANGAIKLWPDHFM